MRVYSCWFGADKFRLMATALRNSLARHEPEADVTIVEIEPPKIVDSFRSNTIKLAAWVEWACNQPDGAECLLIDGDCLLRDSVRVAFAHEFDIAFTGKGTKRLPVNGGVVFFRASERVRAFFRQWLAVNNAMLADRNFHAPYEIRYGGINQASLGLIRENPPRDVLIIELPCAEYNACHEPLWIRWQEARVIHYKSALRRALWFAAQVSFRYRPLIDLHRSLQ